jgi:hypothetical protein
MPDVGQIRPFVLRCDLKPRMQRLLGRRSLPAYLSVHATSTSVEGMLSTGPLGVDLRLPVDSRSGRDRIERRDRATCWSRRWGVMPFGCADLFGDGSVMYLDTHGHTPGHAAVLVRTGGRTLVHAGDAFVHQKELVGEQDLPIGVRLYRRVLHEDRAAVATTLGRLRSLHRGRPDITLLNAHAAELLDRLPAFPARLDG